MAKPVVAKDTARQRGVERSSATAPQARAAQMTASAVPAPRPPCRRPARWRDDTTARLSASALIKTSTHRTRGGNPVTRDAGTSLKVV